MLSIECEFYLPEKQNSIVLKVVLLLFDIIF